MDFEIQKNVLHDYVELLRGKKWNETGSALHNVIRTMRYSRQNRICGEDFSCLDFGNFPLNEIYWSDDGKFPCIFDKSVFHQETFLLDDGHNPYYVVFSKYISLHISWNLFIIFCGNDSIWGHFWYFTWFLFFIFKILFWNFWKFPNGNQVFLRKLCLTTLILIICCLCHFQWTLPPYQYFTIPPFTLSLVLL
mgnify:CR=1 FL=1